MGVFSPQRKLRDGLSVFMSGWVVCVLWAGLLCAEEIKNDDCLVCHSDKSSAPFVDIDKFNESVHGANACVSCHTDITEIPHPDKLKKVQCATCHEDAAKEFSQSIHVTLSAKGLSGTPQCADCHGTHEIFDSKDLRSLVNHFKVDQMCLKCHASSSLIKLHPDMPSADFTKGYEQSVHGRGVHIKGLSVSATCTDCHGNHKILPASDPQSSIAKVNVPETCKTCHLGIYEDYQNSIHGKLLKLGRTDVPVCTDCHDAHGIKLSGGALFRRELPQQCGRCHDEKVATYKDTFHGKATSFGYLIAADCSDCHTAHKILPKSNAQSSINPAQLKNTCGQCHKDINPNFLKYNPHIDTHHAKDSALVYFGLKFMNWLLLFVFGFFSLHTLLWLQRLVVGFLRGEIRLEKYEGDHILRFSRVSRITHMIVVVSFLMLAATGLPIKFSGDVWAKVIMTLFGGVEVTRFIHRFFAVVTFGYLIFHAGQLIWDIGKKRKYHLLSGPDTMLPNKKDFIDIVQNFKWFLYLGKPPHYGKWTYFEKFDYFAVFWGVPVIGISGLILWFPTFFTKFLPGSVINLAMIVHSEEALLAVGFIFTFHFFHNHLRVENFPMDISIFLGSVPLERFKKERPAEYQRLVEEGRLQYYLLPPPPQKVVKKCQIFGFVTLMAGLILLIAIFVTFIHGFFSH